MLVNLACDWGRPSRNWPCAWTPSDYYRFLLSVSRNRFLSTDLQSAFFGSASEKSRPAASRFISQTYTLCSTTKRRALATARLHINSHSGCQVPSLLPYGRIGGFLHGWRGQAAS